MGEETRWQRYRSALRNWMHGLLCRVGTHETEDDDYYTEKARGLGIDEVVEIRGEKFTRWPVVQRCVWCGELPLERDKRLAIAVDLSFDHVEDEESESAKSSI